MANKIFITLLKRKIESFIETYSSDSSSIFKRETGELMHPGEYGAYKERAFKELLRMVIDRDQSISDGFIITSDNRTSTQCDVIIYNAAAIPLIDNGIANFFPIEEVNSIGEIKSTITKTELKKALRKMAKNKQLCDSRMGTYRGVSEYKHSARITIYHNNKPVENDFAEKKYMITYLVCQKIKDCNISEIDWEEIYDGIDRKYWHNAILSVEDGFIGYSVRASKLSPNLAGISKFGSSDEILGWWFPSISYFGEVYKCEISIKSPIDIDKYRYIFEFLSVLYNGISDVYKQQMDPVPYLGVDID